MALSRCPAHFFYGSQDPPSAGLSGCLSYLLCIKEIRSSAMESDGKPTVDATTGKKTCCAAGKQPAAGAEVASGSESAPRRRVQSGSATRMVRLEGSAFLMGTETDAG